MDKVSTFVGDVESYIAHEDGKVITGTVQDMTPYAEHATELRNSGSTGSKDLWHMASLPAAAIESYCNANGIDFREWMSNPIHVKRMVADPALSAFRVHGGSL